MQSKLLATPGSGDGHDVIAQSYDPGAPIRNTENVGLEPVWPYGMIGDEGMLHNLGVRTYWHRTNKLKNDWSLDPLDAARLGIASEVQSTLIGLTEKYQAYPSGMATFAGQEFYVEQMGVLAAAVQEALVQDYDGTVRIAPAWPADWDVDGTVFIQNRSQVHVQMREGVPVTVVMEAGTTGNMLVRNPWPEKNVEVISGKDGHRVATKMVENSIAEFAVTAGNAYVLQPADAPNSALPFAAITGTPATKPKFLGSRSIGLAAAGMGR